MALKFDLANKEEVFNRLMREPEDSASFIATTFGQEYANRYREIMYTRISQYRSLVESLIGGNTADAEDHLQKLFDLSTQLSDFFYDLSPVYPREEWERLLKEYEQLMYYQALAVATGNYTGEIDLFDRVTDLITLITDHAARVMAVALGWSSASGEMPAPGGTMPPPAGSMGDTGVRVTTAIWRFPGR